MYEAIGDKRVPTHGHVLKDEEIELRCPKTIEEQIRDTKGARDFDRDFFIGLKVSPLNFAMFIMGISSLLI